jgi:hypothetical protein
MMMMSSKPPSLHQGEQTRPLVNYQGKSATFNGIVGDTFQNTGINKEPITANNGT